MNNIVVFASGSGTNFQSIIDAIQRGEISGTLSGLITNRPGIGAIERAQNHNIPVKIINPETFDSSSDFSKELLQTLQSWNTDLIALAGYLKKIPKSIIQAFPNRILNIHPALLPKYGGKGFYGMNVHRAVIESGDAESGCSVHIVTEEFDQGPVIAQTKIAVAPDDTAESLAHKVLIEEHKLYPKAIQKHLQNLT